MRWRRGERCGDEVKGEERGVGMRWRREERCGRRVGQRRGEGGRERGEGGREVVETCM